MANKGLVERPATGPHEGEEEREGEVRGLLRRQELSREAQSRTSGISFPPETNPPSSKGGKYLSESPFTMQGKTRSLSSSRPTEGKFLSESPFATSVPPPDPVFMPPAAKQLATPGQSFDGGKSLPGVVDFLFGGEMAIMGMKYDNAGLHWNMDIAKQQWSEQPVWINALNVTSLIGTMAFPALRAATITAKYGKGATLIKRLSGLSHADEVSYFSKLGILDNVEDASEVSSKALELARKQEVYRSRYQDLAFKLEAAAKGELKLGPIDKLRFEFDRKFANKYFEIAGSLVDGNESVRTKFYQNLDGLFRSEDMGRFFLNVPDEQAGARIYQHWLNKMRPGLTPNIDLSPAERQWADTLESAMRNHQTEALEAGMLDANTVKKVGELHIPALYRGTARPDIATTRQYYVPMSRKATAAERAAGLTRDDTIEVLRPFNMPRLDSPTLRTRGAELPEVAERLLNGQLITDPTELTMRGYVMDRLLLNNYKVVTDIATNDRFAVGAADVMAKFGSRKAAEKAGYVSLDQLQGNIPTTLRRMIEKKNAMFLGSAGELPWVRKSAYEDMFGEAGIFAQSQMAAGMMNLLTSIHKTTKTALNVPTHFQNLISNMVFLSQAGFNVLSPQNLKLSQRMAKEFNKIAKAQRAASDLAKATGGKVPTKIEDLGVNLGKIKIGKKVFDLNDEILDPRVRELLEDSSFQSVEGFQNIEKMAESLPSGLTKATAKTFVGAKKILQLGDRDGMRWFDQMTKWYLGEDMVPKMSYYMNLRAQGLTKEAAILEVGRRLPMYGTVGSAIKGARRVVLPWASFPVEALRITKNNLLDNPLRALPWLHLPGIIQSFASAYGGGPSNREEAEAAKRQLPMWAQTGQTVMMNEGLGNKVGGGFTGAVAGGVAGTIAGGATGGLLGAGAGAAAGAAFAGATSEKENADRLRGVVIDWLPHSALGLTSTSPEIGDDTLPWKNLHGMLEQMPAEPLAIFKPIIDIAHGKTAWGEDIGAYDQGDQVGKAIAGMIGFVSPPFIQKYGLKTTTPDISFSEWATGEPIAGDITNVSRLLMDSGLKVDPLTGKPGNFTNEMFLKNFGAWKSWATNPANLLANEQGTEMNFQEIRSHASKNLAYYLENGEDQRATEVLSFVMSTFSNQYADNPRKASEKYGEWLKQRRRAIGRHPRLRTWSEEEIQERLLATTRFAGEERGKARDEMMKFLSNQLTNRRLQRLQNARENKYESKKNKRGRFTRPRYRKSILTPPSEME